MNARDALALEGERLAAEALERKGYRVLERRVRTRLGEIDLLLEKGELVVFAEVKTRRSSRYGAPAEAVDARKVEALVRTASQLLATRRALAGRPARIDVVEVSLKEGSAPLIVHLEDAVESQSGRR